MDEQGALVPESRVPLEAVQAWRQQLIQSVLRIAVMFGFLALAAGSYVALSRGQWGPVLVYLAAYALVVLVTFWQAPYALQAGILLVVLYGMGVFSATSSGLSGDGGIFLLACSALAVLLLGWRWGVPVLVFCALTLAALGVAFSTRLLVVSAEKLVRLNIGLSSWLTTVIVFLMLGALLVFSQHYVFRHLLATLTKSQELARELESDVSERRRAERLLHTLNAVALAMQRALTPNDIFGTVAEELKKLGFSCVVFLTDESRSRLFPKYLSYEAEAIKAAEKLVGIKTAEFSVPINSVDEYKRGVQERQTIFDEGIQDIIRQVLPAPFKGLAGQVARILNVPKYINAPLIVEDEVIGLLSVQSDDLCASDAPAITAFAHEMAAAWHKAQLFEQAQSRSRYLETLQRINATLRSTLPLNQVLETIARNAGEALGYVGTVIAIPDAAGERLVSGAAWGSRFLDAVLKFTGRDIGSFSLPMLVAQNPMVQAYSTGQIQAWSKAPERIVVGVEPAIHAKLASPIAQLMGAELAACVPLPVGDQVIGVLIAFSPREHLSDEERTVLLGLADQAGLAIENARLYQAAQQEIAERKRAEEALERYAEQAQQRAEQLATMNEIGRAVSALGDLDGVLEVIYQQTQRGLPLDMFFIALHETNTDEIFFPVMYDSGQRWEEPPSRLKGSSMTSRVFQSGEPCLMNRAAEDLAQPASPQSLLGNKARRSASLMYAPLRAGERIIGVISAQSYTLNAYDQDDLALLVGIAHQAAIAIENARLYTQAQQEIAERKRAEAALRQSEATLRSILRASPAGIGLVSNRVLLQVNERICDMVGYSSDELVGKSARIFYPSDEEFEWVGREKYAQIHERGTGSVETRWMRKDGQIIDVLLSSTPLDPSDLSAGVTFTAMDITERKLSERALKESEEKFKLLAEQSPNMIFINQRGKILYANKRCEEIMGYTREEFYSADFDFVAITAPEYVDLVKTKFAQHMRGEEVEPYEYAIVTKDGERIEAIIVPRLIDYGGENAILGTITDITARKRVEAALRESEARWQFALEGSGDGVWDWNAQTNQVYFSRQWKAMLGFEEHEIGDTLAEWDKRIHPDDRDYVYGEIHKHFGGDTPVYVSEHRVQCKDGAYKWILDRGQVIERTQDGKPLRVIGTHSDITARKQAEREIQSLARFPSENPNPVLRLDQGGTILYANEASRLVLQDWKTQVGGQSPQFWQDQAADALGDQSKRMVEVACGELVYSFVVAPVPRAGYVNLYGSDVTERRRAEEALRESHERFRAVMDSLGVGVYVADMTTYEILFLNRHAQEIRGDVVGQLCWQALQAGQTGPCEFCTNARLLLPTGESAGPLVWEFQNTLSQRWYECRDQAIRWTDGRMVRMEISTDITERKQAEEQVQRLNAELEQRVIERTAQLEASNRELEAFSYSVSHDLRAPLRAIDGFSRILLEDWSPQLSPEAARYLRIVRENTQHMGHLIDDLLAFSRLGRQPLAKQSIAPAELVRQALESLRHEQQEQQVEISVGELPVCQGDPTLLRQVWINLLSNALKFTQGRAPARIEVGCVKQDGEPVYFVRDNGVGFDMQYAGKLFGVFQRLHRPDEYEGTGVGLAIVQRVIHRHGGRIWAEAEVGKGATFYFTL